VPVVVSLRQDVGVVLQGRVGPEEAPQTPIQVVQVRICLPLLLFRLDAIGDVGEDSEILEVVGQISKPMPDKLKVPMVDTKDQISFLLLEIYQAVGAPEGGDRTLLCSLERFRPMLRQDKRVINEGMLSRLDQITFTEGLDVCIVNIFYCRLDCSLSDVAGYQLDVNLVSFVKLLEVIQVFFEFLILLAPVNGPMLKR